MEDIKKQVIYIGNGHSETPRPGSDGDPMEAPSTSSPENIASGLANTLNEEQRPKDPREALGLLQSHFFDLSALKLPIILQGSDKGNLYVVISWPGHVLGVENGHITADGSPVLKEES